MVDDELKSYLIDENVYHIDKDNVDDFIKEIESFGITTLDDFECSYDGVFDNMGQFIETYGVNDGYVNEDEFIDSESIPDERWDEIVKELETNYHFIPTGCQCYHYFSKEW